MLLRVVEITRKTKLIVSYLLTSSATESPSEVVSAGARVKLGRPARSSFADRGLLLAGDSAPLPLGLPFVVVVVVLFHFLQLFG